MILGLFNDALWPISNLGSSVVIQDGRPGFNSRKEQWSDSFSSPPRPDRLWGPTDLLSNGYRRLFHREWSSWGVNLTTHIHLMPRLSIHGAIPPLPQFAFMAWCSVKSTGTNLPLPYVHCSFRILIYYFMIILPSHPQLYNLRRWNSVVK
jgi:hypothetical protein